MLRRIATQCSTLQGPIRQVLQQQQTQQLRNSLQQTQQQPWRQSIRRLLFSSAEGSQGGGGPANVPKSMLDAQLTHSEVLGSAAQARMRAVQESDAHKAAGPSTARRIFRGLFDFTLIAGLAATLAGGYYYTRYSIPEVEQMLHEAESEPEQSIGKQAYAKVLATYLSVALPIDRKVREYTDPTCDALLPELDPQLRGRVKTLVLDLEDLLVHKDWSRARGWQVLKRPGVEAFLLEMGRRYEVVIYTDEPAMYADPVINKIDPNRAVAFRLYKQDTQYKDGKHVRDLSKLNRDLSQVLFISANPAAYAFQPENTLKLKPWNHSPNDTTLLDLIPFLQMVQEVHVQDVRDVVRSYDGDEDVAAAFKQRMAQLAATKKGGSRFGMR
eukprot:GHUV01002746.1.p1 GENE.GHUV01002746.1~~GHUV01002746.1.p1  ORF type:complete len:384 (+),score=76.30 GHUV01002746.1:351-1502(+)